MRCRNCNFEFCWICRQACPRHEHPHGGCNKPAVDSSEEERFKFYFQRYVAHDTSSHREGVNISKELDELAAGTPGTVTEGPPVEPLSAAPLSSLSSLALLPPSALSSAGTSFLATGTLPAPFDPAVDLPLDTQALLVDCRRTLKYTYVHAFGLAASPSKRLELELLEQQQQGTSYV